MHQLLIFVMTVLYFVKTFDYCVSTSEVNSSGRSFFTFLTSKNLQNEDELYLKTTQNSIHEVVDDNSSKSYKNDFLKPLPVISDPLFEDDVENISFVKELMRKRHTPERGFTHENKMMLLQLHNLYRSNVTPTAGNMAYMEWDVELAELAQTWSDGCIFDHGMPENDYPDTIGQNLYIGTDPTGYLGLYLWFEEHHHYDLRNDSCLAGKQCGHYIQMAWYLSDKLGCGMTKCGMRYLITCHYSPQALKGPPMYLIAKPCSQCPAKKGSLCVKNLCMTWDQCKNNPFDCQFAECNIECHNCGRLDKERCLCECKDGWDSPDCSYICTDKNERCGKSPGWTTKTSCNLINYAVAETYCRKMCDRCNAVNISISNDTCCDGMLCDEGFVLDVHENSCKCKLLCPGPLCDGDEELGYSAALSGSNIIYLNLHFTYSIPVFLFIHKFIRKIF